ncbi:hypothetical protein FOXG_22917 [Fusarium oxysporum f. sp. lycopersici 4287]|uniref:Heterokaryon incompatibility domain-containing protein n=1 Tax=Fusarium oxysporum f. sp. lycopersici (strain 4287 / CBS 123668 / FGSC 9935 / NRRL 34936) TaxID=426428 RepID=A0A0J9WDE9_FUSO4|nr:uncharacterized protein FOXG_22917 [Fusarium oxysporum f. sp. lycopersici 4287]KNB20746.1 hypothetical protein FOXG_22917 [Fusarium oxysporum f. sp. lycopersici 4287]
MGADSEELLKAFQKATAELKLCPNRVWTVARKHLPKLLPDWKSIPNSGSEHEEHSNYKGSSNHESCTFDFCEYSQRDFTAVQQRHECQVLHKCHEGHECQEGHRCQEGHECQEGRECKRRHCVQLRGLFPRKMLNNAAERGVSTVWGLDGKSMIEPPQPYMAISHVWSDGTGTGTRRDGVVNECLYTFFREIAKRFQCDGIWWDTLCIPREKAARNKAIQRIQSNYQDARITLVHDCFLRNWEWDPQTACFAILMSPWFSRGWTALELAKSRKVKVIFKGRCGPLIKDLDEEILAKDNEPDGPRKEASWIIKSLRKNITTLNELLTVLGARYTSWPKDRAVISGLLAGVEVAPKHPQKDIWQQDIYKGILRKIGSVSPGHLFHNSATMSKVCWCPTSLFNMPMTDLEASLKVTENLDLIGTWRRIPVDYVSEKRYIWNGTHPLVEQQLRSHLRALDKCALLAEYHTESVGRAILAKEVAKERTTSSYQYVGAVYFHPALTEDDFDKDDWYGTEAILLNDAERMLRRDGSTCELDVGLSNLQRGMSVEQFHFSNCDLTGGTERRSSSETASREHDQAHNDSEPSLLTSTALTGDEEAAKSLLRSVGPIAREPVSRRTALHYAIWRGYRDIFNMKTADLDVADRLGQQLLHLAAERGEVKTVQDLLFKADLEAQCKNGQTALHRAAWGGSTAIVELLLQNGSQATAKDNNGNIALHIAAQMGFEPVVNILLKDEKIPVDAEGCNNLTPLHFAAMNGHKAVVQLLVENGANVAAMDSKIGWTPLHCAAENGDEGLVKILVEYGADVNAEDCKTGWTPLHFAAMNGHKAVVQLLVEKGANIEAEDKYGWTPRWFAEINEHLEVVELLPSEGAKDTIANEDRWTPLHCGAISSQQGLVKLLFGNGSDLYFEGKVTPVLFAAENGLRIGFQRLLERGANIKARDSNGRTSLWRAAQNGHEAVVELLLEKGADIETMDNNGQTPLLWAVENGREAIVELLLEKSANVEAKDRTFGRTPLWWAVQNGYKAIVELLLEKGADIETMDKYGQTPLLWAVENSHEAIVELLLEKGADIEAMDDNGWTPLLWVSKNGHEAIVELLLEKGANVEAKDRTFGRTPLLWAVQNGHKAIVELLLEKGANVEVKDRTNRPHAAIVGPPGRGIRP